MIKRWHTVNYDKEILTGWWGLAFFSDVNIKRKKNSLNVKILTGKRTYKILYHTFFLFIVFLVKLVISEIKPKS